MKWDGHYLSIAEAVKLAPLSAEAKALEAELVNGEALHLILEEGEYSHDVVRHCITYIESGNFARALDQVGLQSHNEERQLAFAKALLGLTEQQIEMVCEGSCITQDLFDYLYDEETVRQ